MTDARQIADERLARGEIDAAQHAAIVSVLAASTEPAGKQEPEKELTPFGHVIAFGAAVNFVAFLISLFFLNTPLGKGCAVIFGLALLAGVLGLPSYMRAKKSPAA